MPFPLKRRGTVWHYSGTVAGRRLRGSTGTTGKKRATRIAAEKEAKAWNRHLDGPDVTFANAASAYREAGKPTRFLERVEDHFRDTPIRDISAGAVRAAALKLYPDAANVTRNRQAIVPICAIINFAAELHVCSPIKVRRFKVATKPSDYATADWVTSFAQECSPHLGALALFMFGTGARISEAINVTWADVDFDKQKATIRQTKVDDTPRAHLPPPVINALACIPSNRCPDEKVFPYAARDSVYDLWNATVARAGVKAMSPHSCRHGFAVAMLRAGYDPKTVAKRGGWKDAATVLKHYAHALEDETITDAVFGTNLTQPSPRQDLTNSNKRKNTL